MLTLQPSAGTADLNALFFGAKKGGEEGEEEPARYAFLHCSPLATSVTEQHFSNRADPDMNKKILNVLKH